MMLQQDKQMKEIKVVVFKNCDPIINCKSEINNTEIDDAKDIYIVMPMYNITEYSNNHFKYLEVYGNITNMSQMII